MKSKILIVDDKKNTLKVVGAILKDEGYKVFRAQSSREAKKIFEERGDIDAVLADLKMPGGDGLELYRKIRAIESNIPFVIMTAHGTIESAVQAMKEGVTNYLIKPLNYEELSVVLERAIREKEISRQLAELRQEVKEKYSFQNIIGSGQKMRDIFEMLRAVAPTDASILIQGETGTGKELLAKAIHSLSRRQNRNMVCINSAALAESLLEAELFGYVKGAFTGAVANKKGRFESADGGTLFLDEIGQTSLKFQSKLLRFLQEGTFEPVGSVESRRADVRVITASNRILQEEIEAGRFLSDLFYRIEVISITLPPLRERKDDIPLLVNHFIKRYAKQYQKAIDGIDPQAIEALLRHEWPGNVRELENCIARAVILCKEHTINRDDLPEKMRILNNKPSSILEEGLIRSIPEQGLKIKEMERELILKTLAKCEGNKSLTANFLGISRKALYEKIERHGIGI
ncbi:MAG: sigma-54-dependent Fis family transcriptional regulator [Desulfobacteraceae bacterium]|nr:sigma-54-dependent Fis family transcriptional regulator [Desulfobacteraceae bacterium]